MPYQADRMEDFVNRVKKSRRELERWASRHAIQAYRIYDRDIPGFPFVVDRYGSWVVVSSMAREESLVAMLQSDPLRLKEAFGVESERVVWRERSRQRGSSQYQRLSEMPLVDFVVENGLRFEINLTQYLDVGLFLDHRKTRMLIGRISANRRCLNLFCYTGSVSVAMAQGGASHVDSVDMSRTYLDWAQRNFELSGMLGSSRYSFLQQDVLGWLEGGAQGAQWDLIFVDPPSFSNSKRMNGTFDVQRDHQWLLDQLGRHIAPGGVLIFSNNRSGFRLEANTLVGFRRAEISAWTNPKDFRRRHGHTSFVFCREDQALEQVLVTLRGLGPDL
jgi:23S rRNA (guanine2445-N2)-methyltransferase / 23S rRNA (guanine2069-N7)-methyltransferase